MSLTLVCRTKRVRFSYTISMRRVVTLLVMVFGLAMISSRSTYQVEESQLRVSHTQSGLDAQQAQVDQLKTATEQQLTGMMIKLGDLQGQMHKLNALGSKLVEHAELNPAEFGFNELPPSDAGIPDNAFDVAGEFDMVQRIDSMIAELDSKSQQLLALESILMNHHIDEQRYLAGRPIKSGWLSSYYGMRKDPFSGLPAMHKGLDFAGKEGSGVIATGAGLVTWAGDRFGYGQLVEIDHGDGLVTRYGHNKTLKVKIGDVVTKGQVIALMGSTGRSTGAHVHYEVIKNGKQQDPLPYVYRKK